MITRFPDCSALESDIVKHQLTHGLRQALDQSYRRMLEAASREWERRNAGRDPSDACVSVRIHDESRALAG